MIILVWMRIGLFVITAAAVVLRRRRRWWFRSGFWTLTCWTRRRFTTWRQTFLPTFYQCFAQRNHFIIVTCFSAVINELWLKSMGMKLLILIYIVDVFMRLTAAHSQSYRFVFLLKHSNQFSKVVMSSANPMLDPKRWNKINKNPYSKWRKQGNHWYRRRSKKHDK